MYTKRTHHVRSIEMNTGRHILAIVIIIGLATGALADAEVVMRLKSITPSETDDWDSAGGTELQLRLWNSKSICVAATVGYETWNAVEEYVDETDGDDEYRSSVSGSCSVLPIGLSMLYRHPIDDPGGREPGAYFLLEAGIRYGMVDSDIYSEVTHINGNESTLYADTIEIDDVLLASISATLELRLSPDTALEFGVSYQKDLSAPTESWLNEPIGSTSFHGASSHVGLSFAF
jgi:hypothetical protein